MDIPNPPEGKQCAAVLYDLRWSELASNLAFELTLHYNIARVSLTTAVSTSKVVGECVSVLFWRKLYSSPLKFHHSFLSNSSTLTISVRFVQWVLIYFSWCFTKRGLERFKFCGLLYIVYYSHHSPTSTTSVTGSCQPSHWTHTEPTQYKTILAFILLMIRINKHPGKWSCSAQCVIVLLVLTSRDPLNLVWQQECIHILTSGHMSCLSNLVLQQNTVFPLNFQWCLCSLAAACVQKKKVVEIVGCCRLHHAMAANRVLSAHYHIYDKHMLILHSGSFYGN